MYEETIEKQKEKVLDHLKHAYGNDRQAFESLQNARPEDISFMRWPTQGKSRETYLVTVQDKSFILSVNKPRSVTASLPRGDEKETEKFVKFLNFNKFPVAKSLGHFTLSPQGGECEITEYVHGYQKKTGLELDPEELANLAETLAEMHHLSTIYTRMNRDQPETKQSLPQGLIHADFQADNIIFDPGTKKVKAVLDFELTHHNSFAYEIARTLMKLSVKYTMQKDRMEFTFLPEQAGIFLKNYAKATTLSPEETKEISSLFNKVVCDRIRLSNKHNPLLTDDALEYEIRNTVTPALAEFNPKKMISPTEKKSWAL